MQNYLQEDDNQLDDNQEALTCRLNEMRKEWEELRVKNRKLLFGLWIYKFIKNYSVDHSTKSEILILTNKESPISWQKILHYTIAIVSLLIVLICILLKLFIKNNSVA